MTAEGEPQTGYEAAFQDIENAGPEMLERLRRLFPICRSLTGDGNRETLSILSETMDLNVVEVPSGTRVFDWTVPDEWNPRSAEIVTPDGKHIARFEDNNLHLMSYSEPVDLELPLEDLLSHLYSLPDRPDLMPYVTSYYSRNWGFSLPENEKKNLKPGTYKVRIDADLKPGNLVYGEAVLPGESKQEILIDTYICHPSMANDNLAGVVLAQKLYQLLSQLESRKYTYRFVFVPETIGALCWLKNNEGETLDHIVSGLVLTVIGTDLAFEYERSRRGDAIVDRVAEISVSSDAGVMKDFQPDGGSDERQYNSPGFNLPVGMLRKMPVTWPYYHTSGDTVERMEPKNLVDGLNMVWRIVAGMEVGLNVYARTEPRGEPMLSKYGLYKTVNYRQVAKDYIRETHRRMMWLLNYADGQSDLISLAKIVKCDLIELHAMAERLTEVGLLKRIDTSS